ncbi:DUF1028 domain-containing protein [Rhodobacterales bacterium HKCCE4037]|nr:DUF1028 domain-containing protein [Rhodobacterales bacterium HKCCE4037]
MTYSLLAIDENSGAMVAAAATGSLCVGGWVIRGRWGAGLVASQGTAPSTLWREDVLRRMESDSAAHAVAEATQSDAGRDFRQLGALDASGGGAAFTGDQSVPHASHIVRDGFVVSGNMLSGREVLEAMERSWHGTASGDPAERALDALEAAETAGGDARGLLSGALLVLRPDAAPVDCRIDHSEAPLKALRRLLEAVRTPPYADWLDEVPTLVDPSRAPEGSKAAE